MNQNLLTFQHTFYRLGPYGISFHDYSKQGVAYNKIYDCKQQKVSDLHPTSHPTDKNKHFHKGNKSVFINKSDGIHEQFLGNDDGNRNEHYLADNDNIYENKSDSDGYYGANNTFGKKNTSNTEYANSRSISWCNIQ